MDVFHYCGPLARGSDLDFIEHIDTNKQHDTVTLVLVTNGGDPDAAYKIGRYMQARYSSFSLLVPGLCKSAGTLLAMAASEIAFTPYGELGPLDIQLAKTDKIAGMESGLSIQQAFDTLENRASQAFHTLVQQIISSTSGVVSFQTASHAAAEMVSSLFQPIFARIDPEEVGSRTRAMQIASQYGERLNMRFQNLKEGAIQYLVQTFPSHGFVIDREEACELFKAVREASPVEKLLVDSLGFRARFSGTTLECNCLTETYKKLLEQSDAQPSEPGKVSADVATPSEPKDDGGDREAAGGGGRPRSNGVEAALGKTQPEA